MACDYKLYTVEKDGKTVKLRATQLTTQVLSKVFSLFPESILLLSDDGYVETPDEEGRFRDVDDLPIWSATGESMKPAISVAAGPSTSGITPYSYQPARSLKKKGKKVLWSPAYTTALFQNQKPPGVRVQEQEGASTSPEWRKYVEICKWNERESQWKKVSNLPIQLTEQSANVQRVSDMVSDDVFGGDPAILLDIDYLKIPDTANTRGSRFWKTSKRIRAVRKSDFKKQKARHATAATDSSSDSDFERPRKCRKTDKESTLEERIGRIEKEVLMENAELKRKVTTAEEHSARKLKEAESRYTEVKQCFRCLVCKSTASFPAMVSQCCNIVLGCETCITQWLVNSPQCPHCREAMTIDECTKLPFIRSLKDLLGSASDSDTSTSSPIQVD